jgi:uncharacterized OsmC-like protein
MQEHAKSSTVVNGIDTAHVMEVVNQIIDDPLKAQTNWSVTTEWKGGTRSDTRVEGYEVGGEFIAKDFTINIDEPYELGGTNLFANPQEYLLAAMNACMIVGYSAACAMQGIEIEELSIETEGDIDLRGFLGIDPDVAPGYEELKYTVHIKGNATPEEFEKVHEIVCATSPNRFNISKPIKLNTNLVVE